VTATVQAAGKAHTVAQSAPTAVVAAKPSEGGGGSGGGGGAPQTTLVKHPRKRTSLALARFTFTSSQPGSHFECRLDKQAFRSCGSPFKRKTKIGPHVFRVRAVSSAGAVDATPALFRWRRGGR
jgi:hypothetical protein